MSFATRSDIHSFGREIEGGDISHLNRLYWRGDSRTPAEIFTFGFRRRDDTADGYFKRQATWQDDWRETPRRDPQGQNLPLPHQMPGSRPLFRLDLKDIAPATAVCVAGSFKAAALFPLKGDADEDLTWVYAVHLDHGFNTFQMQTQLGAQKLLFAQEACSHDIPSMHVLGALLLKRRWQSAKWEDGALGNVQQGFTPNPKSVGCPGRAAKLAAAQSEIAAACWGDMVMIGP